MVTGRSLLRAYRVLVMLILLLAVVACSGAEEGPSADGSPAPAPAEASPATSEAADPEPDASGVTLITPGDEPRTELRYDLASGETSRATMRQTQALAQTIDGQPATDIEVTLLFDMVADVERDGDTYTARSSVRNGRAGDDVDPQAAAALEASLAMLEDLTIVETFDARGQLLDSEMEGLDALGGDPGLLSTIEGIQQGNIAARALPAEPVGVGARWSVTADLEIQGIPMTQTTEYEVLSIDGDVVELAVTSTQEVAPGTEVGADDSAMGAGLEVQLWDVAGEGTMQLDLTSFFPTAEQRVAGRQEMAITVDGGTSALEQDVTNDLELTPN